MPRPCNPSARLGAKLASAVTLVSCALVCAHHARAGTGSSIVVAGQTAEVGRTVVLWSDPQRGFNGYDKRCIGGQTGGCCDSDSSRFGERQGLRAPTREELAKVVRQVVLHFDGCVNSASCFKSMHNRPRPGGGCGLSAHFMIDADGTIYQTLDLVARAYHAEQSNNVSVGIELCNRGQVNPAEENRLPAEYRSRPTKRVRINGRTFVAYDFRHDQYESLIALLRTLIRLFPLIKPVIPEKDGAPFLESLQDPLTFDGIVGHLHVDREGRKWDPGALDWARIVRSLTGFTLPVHVGSYSTLPRTHEALWRVKRSLFAAAEELGSGFFPVAPAGLWHSGVHLRTAPGAEVVAVADGQLLAARKVPGPAARSFVLIRHDVPVSAGKATFFTLSAQLALPPVSQTAAVPWVQSLSRPDRQDERRRYEAGEIVLLNERVHKGERIGHVGLIARGPEQGPELHFETFSTERLPDEVDVAFRHLNAAADGVFARRADIISLVADESTGRLGAAELKRFFRQGDLVKRQTLQRLAVRHVHEWSSRGAQMLLGGSTETRLLSDQQRRQLADVAIAPYVFLTPEVARHAGLPENALVHSYHPLTLLLQLASLSAEAGMVWSGGRALSNRSRAPSADLFPLLDWTAAPAVASYKPLFGPPFGERRQPKLRSQIRIYDLPPTEGH